MNEAQPTRTGRLVGAMLALGAVALLAVGMLAGSLFTSPARAAGPLPDTTSVDHAITVSGVGEIHVQPDQAQIMFQIHLPGATADAALAAYNQALAALTASLKAHGLADKDIVVNPAATWPTQPMPMVDPGQPGKPADGYVSDGMVTVTVRDLPTLNTIVMDGLKAGAGIGIGGVQYGLQNDQAQRNTAMQQAIDNARAQADAVAAKLGLTVKSVTAVTVQPTGGMPGPWMAAGKGAGMDPASGVNVVADLGTRPDMVVSVTVQVSYSFQ